MGLQLKLDQDLKDAMRGRDRPRTDVIRQVKASITNQEVKLGSALTESQIEEIVTRLVRQHRESIEMFSKGSRDELVEKETAELNVLLSYLPEQLPTDEIRALAERIADDLGARGPGDRGKLMGKLMPEVKGKAEGKTVGQIADAVLESRAG